MTRLRATHHSSRRPFPTSLPGVAGVYKRLYASHSRIPIAIARHLDLPGIYNEVGRPRLPPLFWTPYPAKTGRVFSEFDEFFP
jgi:hypothetical protein